MQNDDSVQYRLENIELKRQVQDLTIMCETRFHLYSEWKERYLKLFDEYTALKNSIEKD